MPVNRCKSCPCKLYISGAGVLNIKSKELTQCCRFERQLEALKRLSDCAREAQGKRLQTSKTVGSTPTSHSILTRV
jgi:hypothetical protein